MKFQAKVRTVGVEQSDTGRTFQVRLTVAVTKGHKLYEEAENAAEAYKTLLGKEVSIYA